MRTLSLMIVFMFAATGPALAGEADVLHVEVIKSGANTFTFDVTVKHDDSGWDHYADKWEIIGPAEAILGTRVLYHPHVDEQPFTRSLRNVTTAASIRQVSVRAHCSVHGYGGKEIAVPLPH